MREWNANSYHKVSTPQFDWGTAVLDRLPLEGHELVFDIGCGTGRLTEKLLERLPRGRVIGIDLSSNMLQVARHFLRPRFRTRIQLLLADAALLPAIEAADAIFSTATFHWVRDHPQLFSSLYAALKPGGRVVAQCGGGPNIERLHAEMVQVLRMKEVEDKLAAMGSDAIGNSPAEFAAFLRAESEKWGKVVRAAGMKPD